jgi:protein SCO1/2
MTAAVKTAVIDAPTLLNATARRSVFRQALVMALTVSLCLLMTGCDRLGLTQFGKPSGSDGSAASTSFKATDITGAAYGKTLELTDHTGAARTLADFRGKLVVLFFGFTQCPDVCPTTLVTMAEVMKQLGPDADKVQVLFVTLDPERDTPTVLAGYVTAFDPRFLGLSGDAAATTRAAREFKVFMQRNAGTSADNYSIDHTAASYVIDRAGQLRLYVRHGASAADVAADLKLLLRKS